MKNNKGLIITLIVVFSICAICLSFLLGFLLTNKNMGLFNMARFEFASKSKIIYNEEFLVSDISKMEVYSSSGDITIKETDTSKIRVRVYGKDKNSVQVNHSNHILNIDYKDVVSCIGFCFYREDIEILVPRNYKLDANIESKYGDITIGSFNNGRVAIDSNSGDIDIKNISDVNINSRYGDINIVEVTKRLSIKSSSGDIEIDHANLLEDSKIVSSYGEIEIDQIGDVYVDAKTDFGDVDIKSNNRYAKVNLVINSNSGDIEID